MNQADLNKKLKFDDAIYDAIICCGTFTRGHVGPDVLIELMRILKKSAPLACTINSSVWIEKEFARWIETAITNGLLALEEKSSEDYFSKSDEKGFFCILRKCLFVISSPQLKIRWMHFRFFKTNGGTDSFFLKKWSIEINPI